VWFKHSLPLRFGVVGLARFRPVLFVECQGEERRSSFCGVCSCGIGWFRLSFWFLSCEVSKSNAADLAC